MRLVSSKWELPERPSHPSPPPPPHFYQSTPVRAKGQDRFRYRALLSFLRCHQERLGRHPRLVFCLRKGQPQGRRSSWPRPPKVLRCRCWVEPRNHFDYRGSRRRAIPKQVPVQRQSPRFAYVSHALVLPLSPGAFGHLVTPRTPKRTPAVGLDSKQESHKLAPCPTPGV